ncbi:MAG TPA: hypothetical protein VL401_01445 [Alphaproteobacteria bacterium]|jgi:hypothetical protein|nr:hypothetical protein [Alphaproteobacteria bacterium]
MAERGVSRLYIRRGDVVRCVTPYHGGEIKGGKACIILDRADHKGTYVNDCTGKNPKYAFGDFDFPLGLDPSKENFTELVKTLEEKSGKKGLTIVIG